MCVLQREGQLEILRERERCTQILIHKERHAKREKILAAKYKFIRRRADIDREINIHILPARPMIRKRERERDDILRDRG